MTPRVVRSVPALLPLLALALASCGMDETYTGMGTGALPGDPLYTSPDAFIASGCGLEGAENVPLTAPDLSGRAWQFDSLSLAKPLPESMNALVNGVITDQIDTGKLVLMMAVAADDRVGFKFDLKLGAGVADGDAFRFDPAPAETTCKWTDARFDTTAPTRLDIAVDMGGEEPLTLPIEQVNLSGVFAPDGSAVYPGLLTGVLTVAAAEKIELVGTSLKELLEGNDPPIKPDVDRDQDGTPDAWGFEGCFTTASVSLK